MQDERKKINLDRLIQSFQSSATILPSFRLLIRIISEIQLICLVIRISFDSTNSSREDSVTIFLERLTAYLTYRQFDQNFVSTTEITAILLLVLLALVITLNILALALGIKGRHGFITKYTRVLRDLNVGVTFLLFVQAASIMLQHQRDTRHKIDGFGGLAIPILVVSLAIALLETSFSQNYLPLKETFASRDAIIEVLNILYKFADTIISVFVTNNNTSAWIRIILCFLYLFEKTRRTISFPYHQLLGLRISLISICIQWSFLLSAFIVILSKFPAVFAPYFSSMLSVITIKIILSLTKTEIEKLIQISVENLANEDQFFQKLFAIRTLLDQGFVSDVTKKKLPSKEILMLGLLQEHSAKCESSKCFCKLILNKSKDASEILRRNKYQIYSQTSLHIIREIHEQALKKFPNSAPIQLSLAYSYFSEGDSMTTALVLATNCKKNSRERLIRICAASLLDKIEARIHKTEQYSFVTTLSVLNVYKYHKLKSSLKEHIKASTKSYIEFWETYIQPEPNMRQLIELNKKIDKQAEEIEKIWNEMIRHKQKGSQSEYLLYSNYLSLVRNAPYSSEEVMRKFREHHIEKIAREELNIEDVYSHEVVTLFIDMEKESKGNIVFCSQEEIFGYPLTNLRGKNIKMLVPSCYQESCSNEYIFGTSKEEEEGSITSTRTLFLQHKEGNILPVQILISLIQYLDGKMLSLVFLKRIKTDDEFLILSREGIILCASKGLFQFLQLDSKSRAENKFQQICSKGKAIIRAFHEQMKESTPDLESEASPNYSTGAGKINEHMKTQLENEGVISKISNSRGSDLYYNIRTMTSENINHKTFTLRLEQTSIEDKKSEGPSCIMEDINEYDVLKVTEYHQCLLISRVKNHMVTEQPQHQPQHLEEDQQINPKNITNTMKTNETIRGNIIFKIFNRKHQGQESMTSSNVTDRSVNAKLEEAIYFVEKHNDVKALKWSMIIHILLSIILYIIFYEISAGKLRNIPKIVDVSTANFNRHYNVWLWGYWTEQYTRLQLDDYVQERFGLAGDDMYYYFGSMWTGIGEGLLTASKSIYGSIELFEKEYQDEFFEPIRINLPYDNSQRTIDIFVLDTYFDNAMLRIQKFSELPKSDAKSTDPDFLFIRHNTLDDQYIVEENIYNLVTKDISSKLTKIKTFSLALNFVIIGLSIVIFGLLVYQTLVFFRKRNIFVDAFIRIGNEEIEKELQSVQQFYNKQLAADNSGKLATKAKQHKHKERGLLAQKEAKNRKAKIVDTSNLNFRNYKNLFFVLFFMTILSALCTIIYTQLEKMKKNVEEKVAQAVETNLYFNHFSTAFLSLYPYILGDTITIKNKPFEEAWQYYYDIISNSAIFFNSLRQTDDEEFLAELDHVLKEDLCTLMYDFTSCFVPITVAKNGLLSINSLIAKGVRFIKESYDSSNKTREAAIEILHTNEFIDVEWAYWLYQPPGLQKLEEILKNRVVKHVDEVIRNTRMLIAIFSVCFLIFIWLFLQPIWNVILTEKILLEKMTRVIPINIIKKNSFIKNYLINNSNGRLKQINNSF